jgi:DNA-binding transcriptional LysR family regulator
MFRFFEAAARHLNFTRAVEEMHVTHGVRLFSRSVPTSKALPRFT